MIDNNQRVSFLNRIHLFIGISEAELHAIAASLQERSYSANSIIFERGSQPDGFYLIYKGRTKVSRPSPEGEVDVLAMLSPGDYFGEEALFEKRRRSATLTAEEDCVLLFLSRVMFDALVQKYDRLRANLIVSISSHKLARATRFKWLGQNEVIYFMARRHILRLYQTLVYPVLSLIFPILLFIWGGISGATTPLAVAGLVLLGIGGWIIWLTIDWSNDYYIVTNQRVIWLEKVIFLYDSRQEAPLGTLLSVGVETDFLGRQLNYGHVNVRTFVGNIRFEYVNHPEQAADMVREYWDRTKVKSTQVQKDAMKNALRAKMGLPVIRPPDHEMGTAFVTGNAEPQRGLFWVALANMFKLRQEDGATIIYHKHWVVLIQQAWRPLLTFFFLLTLFILRIASLYNDPTNAILESVETGGIRPDTFLVTLLFFMFLDFLWLGWEYWDWSNDIFMVNNEEIMDLDKKPLGKEERRTAQIENILSTEYKRIGFLGNVFNFGTVYITVGGSKLSFQDVLDPAGVMADINRRRMVRIAKKNEDATVSDRERMATWVAAYHLNREEFANASKPAPTGATGPMQVPNEDDLLDDAADFDGDDGDGGMSGEG